MKKKTKYLCKECGGDLEVRFIGEVMYRAEVDSDTGEEGEITEEEALGSNQYSIVCSEDDTHNCGFFYECGKAVAKEPKKEG